MLNYGRRLKQGVGNYHEVLDEKDQRIIESFFESGPLRLLVASKATTWSLPVARCIVILMDVPFYEGKAHHYITIQS